MTQEEKNLLLQDICMRLPYGVQGITSEGVVSPLLTRGEADWDILTSLNYRIVKYEWKPYLRPMSSMTEEEKQIMDKLWKENNKLVFADSDEIRRYRFYDISVVDFLNSHHFDYRGLIPLGLALKAPEEMYNIKQ